MKKTFLFFSLILIMAFAACGPAAESRESMHTRAKQVQDSIANAIKTAIDEVTATPNAIVVQDTSRKTPH